MRSIFVTGTDTQIGKTVIAAGIASAFKRRGINVGVMKPVATGAHRRGNKLVSDDVQFLMESISSKDPVELVNPVAFTTPVAPSLAAKISGRPINLNRLWKSFRVLSHLHDVLVIEGIGGLLVPIAERYYVADLIKRFKSSIVIVARPTLGTINHTLLTVKVAESYNLDIKGIIINYHEKFTKGVVEKMNPSMLEETCNVPVLGEVPFIHNLSEKNVELSVFDEIINFL